MKLESVDCAGYFEDETQFWVFISDVPESLRAKGRKIDGKFYDDAAFGVGVYYDIPADRFELMAEFPFDTNELCNIFYTDNDGERHWFQIEIPEDFINEIFAECKKIHTGQMMTCGYTVRKSILFDNRKGFVLAEKSKARSPFIVCHFSLDESGRREYTQEQFFKNKEAAECDYFARSRKYQEVNGVKVVESWGEQLQEAKQEAARRTASPAHKRHNRDAR